MNITLSNSIPIEIKVLFEDRIVVVNPPDYYKISGVVGSESQRYKVAYQAYSKLKAWAESQGGGVNIIKNRYPSGNTLLEAENIVSNSYLLVEINDPIGEWISLYSVVKNQINVK
ncbi:hypothetical protein [Bacillus sp. 1P06AnD]|uniref:hypothetical protein n=1 Tax=Bacillus sp. 1P06AnD TaxID=3132208 RepID=UPI00399F01A8